MRTVIKRGLSIQLTHSHFIPDTPIHQIPVYIHHGLFSNRRNWEVVAKGLCKSGFETFSFDARNHGDSPYSAHMSYEIMANDIEMTRRRFDHQKIILVGHSMGGVTSMLYSLLHPDSVDKLVVVDMSPFGYEGTMKVNALLDALEQLVLPVSAINLEEMIQMAVKLSGDKIEVKLFQQFLSYKMVEKNGFYNMNCNLPSIIENRVNLGVSTEKKGFVEGVFAEQTLFIGGQLSPFMMPHNLEPLRRHFPQNRDVYLANSGHSLHLEQPQLLLEELNRFLLQ